MIITYDENFPLLIYKINNFQENDYKTLIKQLEYHHNKAISKNTFINIYIDLYHLDDYSNYYLQQIINYVSNYNYTQINSVKIFIDKKNSTYLLKTSLYISNSLSKIPIDLVELDKPKNWINK